MTTALALWQPQPASLMVPLGKSPLPSGGGGGQPERGSRSTAGRRELGQTHSAEQVFAQKDHCISRVANVGYRDKVLLLLCFCPTFRPRGGNSFISLLFPIFISNLLFNQMLLLYAVCNTKKWATTDHPPHRRVISRGLKPAVVTYKGVS